MCVEAQVLGEHGTSQVFLSSSARVAGIPVRQALAQDEQQAEEFRQRIEQDVGFANIKIIEGTGASHLGIGMVAARIAEAILPDERAAIPVGAYNERYGVTLSLPTVIGCRGLVKILEPEMTDAERNALGESADKLRQTAARLEH